MNGFVLNNGGGELRAAKINNRHFVSSVDGDVAFVRKELFRDIFILNPDFLGEVLIYFFIISRINGRVRKYGSRCYSDSFFFFFLAVFVLLGEKFHEVTRIAPGKHFVRFLDIDMILVHAKHSFFSIEKSHNGLVFCAGKKAFERR